MVKDGRETLNEELKNINGETDLNRLDNIVKEKEEKVRNGESMEKEE